MADSLERHNREILARRFPSAWAMIQSGGIEPGPLHSERVMGERGTTTVAVTVDERKRFLHSKYDPLSEAQRWAASQPPPKDTVALILGWGLGYHAIEWLKQHGRSVRATIVVEPEPELFLQSLDTADLRAIPPDVKIDIILGTNGERIYQSLLAVMEALIGGDLITLPLPFADIYPKEFLSTLQNEIRKIAATRDGMLQHMAVMGDRCQECLIRNIPAMANSLFPRAVRGIASGQPGIVVAAGPSLDRNLGTLTEARDRAWIFAVDTSLRVLLQHGMSPHFTVTKDPTDLNRAHFEGLENLDRTTLVFDPQTDPAIPKRFPGQHLLMPNRNNALHSHIAGLVLEADDRLPLSTNSAVAAFNMAVAMGCDPIIFVGLDLCFSADSGRSHSKHTALASETRFSAEDHRLTYTRGEASDEVQAIEVEGIDGNRYPTTTTFLEALRLLENLIRASNVRCIDASEGGAKITGTEIVPLAEALSHHCLNPIDVSAWKTLSPPRRHPAAIKKSLSEIVTHIETCGEIAAKALSVVQSQASGAFTECENARHRIEEGYRLYHVLQSALERLMAEIARSTFWDTTSVSEDELLKRYEWYFSEIQRACKKFGEMYYEVLDEFS